MAKVVSGLVSVIFTEMNLFKYDTETLPTDSTTTTTYKESTFHVQATINEGESKEEALLEEALAEAMRIREESTEGQAS